MVPPTLTRPPETTALLDTLAAVGPRALTSCPGWSAHHIAAHIAGNHQEARRHVAAYADGRPLAETRSFEEREAPLLRMRFDALLRMIESEETGLLDALGAVLEEDGSAELRWTGRTVTVKGFPTHMRSEMALHRWDVAGDDETSWQLLSQPDLLAHAVDWVGRPLLLRGAAEARGPFTGRVRSPDRDDLLIGVVRDRDPVLEVTGPVGPAVVECDAAARLLLLWGRKAEPFHRLRANVEDDTVGRLQSVLAGY
ncbi:MAG TPA: maleylpyruvate isomerase family mycothiol-dependent enzyme [Acidimicrobiia bacterium]|nr:maleylpyruvate isomerase family mycothiol-dependent enzyme [Acidimicrobiia bacterium]